jgi:hypothetical protein
MRARLLLPCAFLVFPAQAQITIGAAEMPHAGDDLLMTRAVPNPLLNFSATGPAHTWDFTNLVAQDQNTTSYQSVASTNVVYAVVYADLFFNPNRANHARAGVDIPFYQALPIEDPYTFLYRGTNTYRKIGFGAELSGIPAPVVFDEQDEIYALPLQYGGQSSSHSAWKVSLPTLAYYGYEQMRTNHVDGWGSISTPAGTFDVLRVKTTLEGRDTIHVDTLSVGFAIDRPIVREYKWLAQGLRVPVLQINTTEVLGVEVVSEVYFHDLPRNVEVAQPLPTMLCAGMSIAVPYTATGVFNSGGFLQQGNVFRAHLSNANGEFANPVVIGSVTATTSGSINATIPANTPPGNGYRIRVIATNPAFTGPDNGVDLVIGTAPVASVQALGATSLCVGDSVVLMADASGGAQLQWLVDGDPIAGADDVPLVVTTSGAYQVQATNTCGNALSPPIAVVVNEPPVNDPVQTFYTACAGEPVLLEVTNTSGPADLGYQWYLADEALDGANADVFLATLPGSYTVEVIDATTGCTATVGPIMVELEHMEPPVITTSGPTAFCEGGSVVLSATTNGTVQWFDADGALAGAVDMELVVPAPGVYHAVAISANGCVSDASEAVTVVVHELPEVPAISATSTAFCAGGSVLLSTDVADLTSQWSLNGEPVGGDAASLEVVAGGTYKVVVTNAAGCSVGSEAFEVTEHALPEVPLITVIGNDLVATGEGTFSWWFNGEPLDNGGGSTVASAPYGEYTVVLTDANGCSSTSAPYHHLGTAVGDVGPEMVGVFPNPNNGAFLIRTDDALVGAVFELLDAAGRVVVSGSIIATEQPIGSHVAPGVMFLRVVKNGRVASARVMVL